jgi:hypothetical protein
MCLPCATPVRGQAYGSECLQTVLGTDAPASIEPTDGRPVRTIRTIAVVAFGAAIMATTLPWSRFGPGSGAFGAWTRAGRWSLVAGSAAVAGLVLSIAALVRSEPSRRRDAILAIWGGVVATASLLSVAFPPAFSRPWLGPWVAVVAGAVACVASVAAGRSSEKDLRRHLTRS